MGCQSSCGEVLNGTDERARLWWTIILLTLLTPTGWFTGSREGVPNTLRAGMPAFAMVCQKPEGALNRYT